MLDVAEPFPAINHLSTECDKEAVCVHISGEFETVYMYISCNTSGNEVSLNRLAINSLWTFVSE